MFCHWGTKAMTVNPPQADDAELDKLISDIQYYRIDEIDAKRQLLAWRSHSLEIARLETRINIVRNLIWHHSITDGAEQALLDKIVEWEAALDKLKEK